MSASSRHAYSIRLWLEALATEINLPFQNDKSGSLSFVTSGSPRSNDHLSQLLQYLLHRDHRRYQW